jgi:hypothetical protein
VVFRSHAPDDLNKLLAVWKMLMENKANLKEHSLVVLSEVTEDGDRVGEIDAECLSRDL